MADIGKPVVFGPPGGSSGPAQTSPAPAASGKRPEASNSGSTSPGTSNSFDKEMSNETGAAASSSPTSQPNASNQASSKTQASSTSSSVDVATPFAVGAFARIYGLTSESGRDMNGRLCQVAAIPDKEKSTVRIAGLQRLDDKGNQKLTALKNSKLDGGLFAVCPKHTKRIASALSALTLFVAMDIFQARGRNSLSAAAVPVLGAVYLVGTLGICGSAWWRCKPKGVWITSISDLSSNRPFHHVYRVGFLMFAVLLAATIFLYQEILLTDIDVPAPRNITASPQFSVPVPSPPPVVEASADSKTAQTAADTIESEDTPESNASIENATANATANASVNRSAERFNEMLAFGLGRSLKWGYAASAGLGLQAIVCFDGKLSLQSVVHVAGVTLFAIGAMQHSGQSNFWLALPRKSSAEIPSVVASVLRFRRLLAEYGPLVLMMGPLSSQMLSSHRRPNYAQQPSWRSMAENSGMGKSLALTQWALLVLAGAFYASFSCDFWFSGQTS